MSVKVRGSLARPIGRMQRLWPGVQRQIAQEAAEDLVRNIRAFTPIDSGALWNSVRPMRVRKIPLIGVWRTGAYSNLEYASYVEDGTRPHVITPKRRKALHWFNIRGGEAFAKKVFHPGTPAQRMFARGASALERGLPLRWEAAFRRWKITSGI